MTDCKYIPQKPLSEYVKTMWYCVGYEPLGRKERVLPSGASQLIINLGNETFRHFEGTNGDTEREYNSVVLVGVHSGVVFLDAYTRISTMGVVFKPCGLGALLGIPATELQDQVVSLDAIFKVDIDGLRQRLIEAGSPDEKFDLLESFLMSRINQSFQPNPAIAHAVGKLKDKKGVPSIAKVREKIGYSRRRFSELFGNIVGIPPKKYAKICRFQHVLQKIQDKAEPHWSEIAVASGYYDQAHLINDFKSLSGITPGTYLQNMSGEINHLAV